MPQGIIQVSPVGLIDHIDLTIDPALIDLGELKEVLLLPDRYTVEQVKTDKFHYSDGHGYVEVIVSSPDIPETPDGEALPIVTPWYCREESDYEAMTGVVALTDMKVNGVSVFKEEDKQKKRTIALKSIDDSVDNPARDSHFRVFAKVLWDELEAAIRQDFNGGIPEGETRRSKHIPAWQKIIARKAYDLAKSTIDNAREYCLEGCCTENIMTYIPDFTEWPDEAECPRTNQ